MKILKISKKSENPISKFQEFSTSMKSFSKKKKSFSIYFSVRSIPILSFPLLFGSSGPLSKEWHWKKFSDPPLSPMPKSPSSYGVIDLNPHLNPSHIRHKILNNRIQITNRMTNAIENQRYPLRL